MKIDGEIALKKDGKATTTCGVTFQCVGPLKIEIEKAKAANVDERVLTPIQILDIIFRQGLTCPLVQYVIVVNH